MAHRDSFHTSQMPTIDPDQIRNHPHPDSHLQSGNGSFMLPMDGAANNAAVFRPNDYPSSSFSYYIAPNPGPLHEQYLHPSSTASSSRFPPDQVLCVPPPGFNQHGGSMVSPQTEFGWATFKRKSPAMGPAFSGGNTNGYYSAGGSSNLHVSSSSLQPQPMTGPQHWPLDPASNNHSYRSDNLLSAVADSQRNVRSRHNHTLHSEINPGAAYSSSNLPHHFYAAGNLSGHSMEGQLSHVPMPIAPQGRNLSSGPIFDYEGNQSLAGHSVINNTVGANGIFHPSLMQSTNTSSLPSFHDHVTQGVGAGNDGYNQGSYPHRFCSSYTPAGFAAASLEGGCGTSGIESVASSRYSRPLSITGRSSYRNGRTRGSYNRLQSGYGEDSARGRWFAEGAVMMDRATYYDSRNWFDEHRDMRLDIDNMSYEELLALEERIGNVSAGLTEETMSGCLQEITHRSSNQFEDDQEEGKCVICLEVYKDEDKLGRLSCRHDFHVGCIKNWLLIKNACPICKAPASSDISKENQKRVPV